MKCKHCGYEWIAVYPLGTSRFECPRCGGFTPLVVDTDGAERSDGLEPGFVGLRPGEVVAFRAP